jgi:CBS domain-containing protein
MSPDDFNSSSILIQDIMSKSLISVSLTTTVSQIAKMMEQGGIGAVLVKENDNLVGIVTDRDFATKIAANNLPFDTTVDKIMSSPLVTINYDESISAAAERMVSKKIRKLAVTNNGKIVGLITSTDLVDQLAK